MHLIQDAFGLNIKKTRDPKRKLTAKKYYEKIHRDTKFNDLKTGKSMTLEDAAERYGIIDVQLIDFAGSIFLKKDWKIEYGINYLFHRNKEDLETDLLHHKYYLTNFMRNFKNRDAMIEFKQILKYGESETNKFIKFRYTCLKGRILMRMRKLEESKFEFEKAFTLLEIDFSEDERVKLRKERSIRLEKAFENPNWDSDIIDYDEIFLGYLYGAVLNLRNKPEEIDMMIKVLNQSLSKAKKNNILGDIIDNLEMLSIIHKKLAQFNTSIILLEEGIQVFDNTKIERWDNFRYGNYHIELLEVLLIQKQMDQAEKIRNKLHNMYQIEKTKIQQYMLCRADLLIYSEYNNLEASFNINEEILSLVILNKYEFVDVSQMFLIKDILNFVSQGLALGKFSQLNDVDKYMNILKELSKDISVVEIYVELIDLIFQIKNTGLAKNERDFNIINSNFTNLLKKSRNDKLRYGLITLHYFYFLASQSYLQDIDKALLETSNRVADHLNSSPYTILIIKNVIIHQAASGNLEEIENNLQDLNNHYDIKELMELTNYIQKYSSDEITLQELVIALVEPEICYSKFEKIKLEIPLVEISLEKY